MTALSEYLGDFSHVKTEREKRSVYRVKSRKQFKGTKLLIQFNNLRAYYQQCTG